MEARINNNVQTGSYYFDKKEHTYAFNTTMSLTDKIKFINLVTNAVIIDGSYYSLLKDTMFNYYIIRMLSNIDIAFLLSENENLDFDILDNFLKSTGVAEHILNNIDSDLLRELDKSINDNIAYITGIKQDGIEQSIQRLIDKLNSKIDDFDVTKMDKMTDIFSNISDITPEKMIDAYAKSELYKQTQKSNTFKEELKSKNKTNRPNNKTNNYKKKNNNQQKSKKL